MASKVPRRHFCPGLQDVDNGTNWSIYQELPCGKLNNPGAKSCRAYHLNWLSIKSPLEWWASLVAQTVKSLPAIWETWVPSLSQQYPLKKEMATHSSTLAWKIPWTEEPGRLQSMGSQRVGHDWVTSLQGINVWMNCSEKCTCFNPFNSHIN